MCKKTAEQEISQLTLKAKSDLADLRAKAELLMEASKRLLLLVEEGEALLSKVAPE